MIAVIYLKLLFAWRDAYRFDRHERRGCFALLREKNLRDTVAGQIVRGFVDSRLTRHFRRRNSKSRMGNVALAPDASVRRNLA